MDAALALVALLAAAMIYFGPVCIAFGRHHRNALAIGATNLLLGWTVIGWVVALVWALTANVSAPPAPAPRPEPARPSAPDA